MLHACSLTSDAACHEAFVHCLQSDGCPILKLQECALDCHILATALTGNSRVASLVLPSGWISDDTRKGVVSRLLAENNSLVHVGLNGHYITDGNWSVLCQSLQAHPTLTSLDLRYTLSWWGLNDGRTAVFPDEQKAKRTSMIAEMMQSNAVLQTIHFSMYERDDQIYSHVILPRLETNRFRPRVLAVKKIVDGPFCEKVLGRGVGLCEKQPQPCLDVSVTECGCFCSFKR
jgi:hypothetical protein